MMSEMTPEELSAKLDKVLPPGSQVRSNSLVSGSDPLIRAALRVSAVPRPPLSSDAKARMAAKMFAAIDAMPAPTPQQPSVQRQFNPVVMGLAASAAAVILIAVGILAVLNLPTSVDLTPTAPFVAVIASATEEIIPTDESATETPTQTQTDVPTTSAVIETATDTPATATDVPVLENPTETLLPATSLPVNTATDVPPTATDVPPTPVQPTATSIPPTEIIPTHTPVPPTAIIPTATATDSPTREPASQETVFIIEGRVEEVLDDAVIIAGFRVQLTEKHPLLKALRAGDVIRIEGAFNNRAGNAPDLTFTLDDSEIVLDNTDPELNVVEVSPDGEVWRDDGTCQNPPPAWANANGWHKRCDNAGTGTGNNGNGNSGGNNAGGNGNGNGNDNSGGNNGGGNGNGNGNSGGNGNGNGGGNGNGNGNGN